jgi:lysophospholipase L1-like esterase
MNSVIDAKTKLACIGNSIAARDAKDGDGYVRLLSRMLGEDYEIKNFGYGGRAYLRKSSRSYWETTQFRDVFKFKPDIITIMLGTCDSKTGIWGKHSQDFRDDVQAMVDTFSTISTKPEIFLAFPPHAFKNHIAAQNKVIVEEIIPILKEIAKKNNLSVIDSHTPTNSPDCFHDGVHPNGKGYRY